MIDLAALERAVEEARRAGVDREPRRVMLWAHQLLGDGLMMTTSFQKGGMILLHMVRDLIPGLPIYFLDTGFHFPETLEFAERIRRDWGLNLILQKGKVCGDEFLARYGRLYETDPDRCCHLNKTEPQQEVLDRHQGWITALRRDQSSTRAEIETLEVLEGPKLKVQPLAYWTREQVGAYLKEHSLPLHPLYSQGYTSIGCAPCTEANLDSTDERAGRWKHRPGKTECGLHTFWQKRGGPPRKAEHAHEAPAVPSPVPPPWVVPVERVEILGTPPSEGVRTPPASPELPKAAAG